MNPMQKAKSMLPNMPNEVFDTWLLPIIRDHNAWPYFDIFSQHPSQQWSQYFGHFSLNDISNCTWHSHVFSFGMDTLDPSSNRTIKALIEDHVCNLETPIRLNVRDSKKRFFGLVEFVKRTGNIPEPIIGLNTEEGLCVLDGNHRLAALTYLGLRGQIQCTTWVGAPNV